MGKLVPIPPESLNRLKKDDLKVFAYQFVSIRLKDRRVFPHAVASEGFVIQVKGFREIPFIETDIESVDADGEPWNFRRRAVRTRTPHNETLALGKSRPEKSYQRECQEKSPPPRLNADLFFSAFSPIDWT